MEGARATLPNETERPMKRPRIDETQGEVTEHKESEAAASTELESKSSLHGDAPRRGKGRGRNQKSLEKFNRREQIARKKGGNRRQEAGEGDVDGSKVSRLPKRQCAILLGFNGTGFSGMQIQPLEQNVRTVENTLFNVMVEAGAISQDNADDPNKVSLARAARTDAGVHAAGNIVSMKMIMEVPGVPDLVSRINELLPPQIRVWSFIRVQNAFNARNSCDSRKYTYFFPTHLLIPPRPQSGLDRSLNRKSLELGLDENDIPKHPFWKDIDSIAAPEQELKRKREWRIDEATLSRIREAASKFEGSHNFHNFTVGKEYREASCSRYMKKIEVQAPEVHGETEWLPVMFHGQSFMLHQRKMISTLVLVTRCSCPPSIIEELFGPRKVLIPKMPALGLLLEYPIFETYNKRVAKANEGIPIMDERYRPPIDFEVHRTAIDEFKQEFIYENMRAVEDRDGIFDAWIRFLDAYAGPDLLWLNRKGIIPPESVWKPGEKRTNPFKEKKKFDTTDFSKPVEVDLEADEEDAENLNEKHDSGDRDS